MKQTLKVLATVAALAVPSFAAAQSPIDATVSLKIVANPYVTNGTGFNSALFGGGYLADFSITKPIGELVFDDYLVWCIDANRGVTTPGGPYSYSAFTADNFAASTLGATNGNDVTYGQMRRMVSLVNTLETNWASLGTTAKKDYQGSIWKEFRGESPVITGDVNQSLDGWMVLYGNENNQTFLTYVPEPSSFALLFTMLGGMVLMVVARRRRA